MQDNNTPNKYLKSNNLTLQDLSNCFPPSHGTISPDLRPDKDGGRTYGIIALDCYKYWRDDEYWQGYFWIGGN